MYSLHSFYFQHFKLVPLLMVFPFLEFFSTTFSQVQLVLLLQASEYGHLLHEPCLDPSAGSSLCLLWNAILFMERKCHLYLLNPKHVLELY